MQTFAHHDFPVQFELNFLKAVIDINDSIAAGRFLPKEFHKRLHGKGQKGWGRGGPWNYQWREFFSEYEELLSPDEMADQIVLFRDQLRALTADTTQDVSQINWPYSKD